MQRSMKWSSVLLARDHRSLHTGLHLSGVRIGDPCAWCSGETKETLVALQFPYIAKRCIETYESTVK